MNLKALKNQTDSFYYTFWKEVNILNKSYKKKNWPEVIKILERFERHRISYILYNIKLMFIMRENNIDCHFDIPEDLLIKSGILTEKVNIDYDKAEK